MQAEAVLAAAFAAGLILVQRELSTPVRHARRALGTVSGIEPMERSLRILPWANIFLGARARDRAPNLRAVTVAAIVAVVAAVVAAGAAALSFNAPHACARAHTRTLEQEIERGKATFER